jgi:hypothetical protein
MHLFTINTPCGEQDISGFMNVDHQSVIGLGSLDALMPSTFRAKNNKKKDHSR